MILVILMYALFASTFTVGKYTLQFVDPYFLTGIRMLTAALILFPFCKRRDVRIQYLPLIFGLGVFNVFITNAFEFWALQYMHSAKASLIYSLSPFFAILLSYIFFKERMTKKKWLGLFIGLIGFLPLFLKPSELSSFSLPELAISISSFTAVVGWLMMKQLTEKYGYSFLTANMYSFVLGGMFSLTSSIFLDSWQPIPLSDWRPFLLGMLYITLIHNVICYNIYAYSIKKYTVSFMTFAGFSHPLFTALWGRLFLAEKVPWSFFLSLCIIFLGIYIYSREEKRSII